MKQRITGLSPTVHSEVEKGMKLLLADPTKNKKDIEKNIQWVQNEIDMITLQIRFERNRKERLRLQAVGVDLMGYRNRLLGALAKQN